MGTTTTPQPAHHGHASPASRQRSLTPPKPAESTIISGRARQIEEGPSGGSGGKKGRKDHSREMKRDRSGEHSKRNAERDSDPERTDHLA